MPKVSVGRAELDTRPHILYRFYDRTGVLLYIGITVDFEQRWKQHAKNKDWWARVDHTATRVEYCFGRPAALDAEREAIKTEKPLENDQHNEWVSVEADIGAVDEAHELAKEILGDLDAELREELLRNCSTDWQDTQLDDRQRDIAAAGMAPFMLRMRQNDLHFALDELLDLLPDGRGEFYRDFVRADLKIKAANDGGPVDFSDSKLIPTVVEFWLLDQADKILGAMPLEEAAEWMGNFQARPLQPGRRAVQAARYASIWKQYGMRIGIHCFGPGQHGARCTNEVDVLAFFEVCSQCQPERDRCEGHNRWCREHAESAQRGDLSMLADDPFGVVIRPILKIEEMPGSPVSEMPF